MVDNDHAVTARPGADTAQAIAMQAPAVAVAAFAAVTSAQVVVTAATDPLRTTGAVRLRAAAAPTGDAVPALTANVSTIVPALSIPGSAEPGGHPV